MLYVNGKPADGDLAFQLIRRGGLWSRFGAAIRKDPGLRKLVTQATGAGMLFAAITWCLETVPRRSRRRALTEALIVSGLLILLLGARLFLAREIRAAPPGDSYNFAGILSALLTGRNPYANEKRLPGYPIALLPAGMFTDDPLLAGKVTNQIIMVLAAGACYLLARRIGFTPRGALLSATAFSLSRDALFIPFHPLSYPLFTLQILLALLLYPLAREHVGRAVILGVTLGWSAETRYEGFVLVAPLLLGLLRHGWRVWRRSQRGFWRAAAPSLACGITVAALLLPFIIHNLRTYGVPLYSAYADAPVTNVRRSPQELLTHLGQTHGVFSSLWWPVWRQEIRVPANPPFWTTVAIASFCILVTRVLAQRRPHPVTEWWTLGLVVVGMFSALLLFPEAIADRTNVYTMVNRGFIASAIAGWGFLLARMRPSRGVFLVGALLTLPPFWVHPAAKNFLHVLPLVALGLGAALDAALPRFDQRTPRARALAIAASSAVFLIASIPIVKVFQGIDGAIERHNVKYVDDTLIREVAIVARRLVPEGNLGAQHWFLPLGTFFDGSRVQERLPGNATLFREWVTANDIRAILWRSNDTAFAEIAANPEQYPLLYETTGRGVEDEPHRVRLYGVARQ